MFELSQIIFNGLIADQNITDLFDLKIYPLLAPGETAGSFITYKVIQNGSATKDGIADYTMIIENYADDYLQALNEAATITTAVKSINYNTRVYKFNEGTKNPGITEQHKTFVTQSFNIKI